MVGRHRLELWTKGLSGGTLSYQRLRLVSAHHASPASVKIVTLQSRFRLGDPSAKMGDAQPAHRDRSTIWFLPIVMSNFDRND